MFIFIVIILSGVIIAGTLKTYKARSIEAKMQEMKTFLDMKPGFFSYDESKKDFSGSNKRGKFLYYRLSPIDGIYYTSSSRGPIRINKVGNKTIITISEGEYVFDLNDIFEKYEIQGEKFRINQLGKGVFFVNNKPEDYKIYSFNSLLRLDLFSDKKSGSKVTFDLFPSLLFKYNPEYNKNLLSIEFDEKTKKNIEKSADVLRISQVDSIHYLDSKDKKFITNLINHPDEKNIVDLASEDIKNKIKDYSQLYSHLLEMNIEDIPGTEMTKDYSSLFQNKTKKAVFLRNTIAKNFIELLKNSGDKTRLAESQENVRQIEDSLGQMQEVSEDFYKEGVSIIKNYYYISYFGNIFDSKGNADFAQSGVGQGMKDIFKERIAGEDYFGKLSDIFYTYQFSDSDKDVLDANIDGYLGGLIENKLIKEEDFLNFSFFLTQYSLSLNKITKSNLNIVNYLLSLFQNYYQTIRFADKTKEEEKRFSTLSIQFYSLTKIIKKINNSILSNYFESKNGNIQLKSNYVLESGDSVAVNIPSEILSGLESVYKVGFKDLQNKKPDFMKFLEKQNIKTTGVKNNFSLLEEQYKKLYFINDDILANYNSWSKRMNLNKENRDAKEIVYDDSMVLSKEDATEYLQKFNGVDISTLKILNTDKMMKDKYYDISVTVNGSKYTFRLYPEDHKISDITITPQSGEIRSYSNPILLDAKEDAYKDSYASAITYADKQKYDFRNFLVNISNIGSEDQEDSPEVVTSDRPTESKFISLFKQTKLMDGDFTFTKKFMDIPFKNISVKIVDEKYVIDINKVNVSLSDGDKNHNIELSSGYNFASKKFEGVNFRLLTDPPNEAEPYEFSGISVDILPKEIGLKEFSSRLADLGSYISVIKSNSSQSPSNIKVDLNSKKVYIDSKSFLIK